MRCYFMKAGRIYAVEELKGQTDKQLIDEGRELFNSKGLAQGAEGFEIWDHARFVYRYVVEGSAQNQPAGDGLKGPPGLLERFIRRRKLEFAAGWRQGPAAAPC